MAKCRDANKTKETITSSAMELFAKDGYEGVSVDSIAKKADINKAMIYYYFKNKAVLYEAVVRNLLDDIYYEILKESKKCNKPIDEMKSFIVTYAKFADENPYLPSLMLSELSVGGRNLPDDMFVGLKRIFSLLGSILKRGEEKGCFEKSLPIMVHFMIVGSINLFITTKQLRLKVENEFGKDICNDCKIEEISEHLFYSIKKMLKGEDK